MGDLQLGDDAIAILNAAAGGCLLGGLLLLTRRRWLWLAGLVMNGLVILFYFRMYQGRPAVYLSPGGLASRSAELLLEVALILLLLTDWMKARRRPA